MHKLKKIIILLTSVALMSTSLYASAREDQLAEAQKRLEEAAREYAELSSELGGDAAAHIMQSFKFSNGKHKRSKARLGINIGEVRVEINKNGEKSYSSSEKKVDGVLVHGVSPEGPAETAGLKAGDIISSLNGIVLLDTDGKSAVKQLTDVMRDVKPGDTVDILYQRDAVTQSASIVTDEMPKGGLKMLLGNKNFDFDGLGDYEIDLQGLEGLESLKELDVLEGMGDVMGNAKFIFLHRSPFGDAELTELSSDLGAYFGADEGLLVVKAPSHESELRDGDVILAIDGRVPTSVNHAMRILRSYEQGENVNLEILRKKRKRKISLSIPEKPEKSGHKIWDFKNNFDGQIPLKKKRTVKVVKSQDST